MTETPALPSYQEVTKSLQKAHSDLDAAQLHGLFCGVICATSSEKIGDAWKELVFSKGKPVKGLEVFEELLEVSYHLLSEFSFEFNLLLPADFVEIGARTEALGLWCQGFLSGLEQHHAMIANNASSDVKEAIDDIIEIAQVNFEDMADNEDDENAYFELIEHVRLSVLMIFQDLRPSDLPQGNVQ